MSVPNYVRLGNTISATLYNFVGGSTIAAAISGAALGKIGGKPATYMLQSALTDVFLKYVLPNTIGKVFMHKESNWQAWTIGFGLSYVASVAIPFLLIKNLLPHTKDIPYIGKLAKENEAHPYKISQAFYMSIAPTVIAILRAYPRSL